MIFIGREKSNAASEPFGNFSKVILKILTICPMSGRILTDRPVCLFVTPVYPTKDIHNESKRKNNPPVSATVFLEGFFEHLHQ